MGIGEVISSMIIQQGVYFLYSKKADRYYIGSTSDISRRIEEHSKGYCEATKFLRPIKLVFFQEYDSLSDARRIEYKLKNLKSRKIIETIIESGKILLGP